MLQHPNRSSVICYWQSSMEVSCCIEDQQLRSFSSWKHTLVSLCFTALISHRSNENVFKIAQLSFKCLIVLTKIVVGQVVLLFARCFSWCGRKLSWWVFLFTWPLLLFTWNLNTCIPFLFLNHFHCFFFYSGEGEPVHIDNEYNAARLLGHPLRFGLDLGFPQNKIQI